MQGWGHGGVGQGSHTFKEFTKASYLVKLRSLLLHLQHTKRMSTPLYQGVISIQNPPKTIRD